MDAPVPPDFTQFTRASNPELAEAVLAQYKTNARWMSAIIAVVRERGEPPCSSVAQAEQPGVLENVSATVRRTIADRIRGSSTDHAIESCSVRARNGSISDRPFVLFCFVLFVLQLSVVPQWASATTAGPFSMWGFRVTAEETRCRIAT